MSRPANRERADGDGRFRTLAAGSAMALIDYGGGLFGHLLLDSMSALNAFIIGVHGERRSAILRSDGLFDRPTLEITDGSETVTEEIPPETHDEFAGVRPDLPPFVSLLDAFASRIDGGVDPLPSFEDGLATQRVLESVGYSAPSVGDAAS